METVNSALVRESWCQDVAEEGGHLIETQDLFHLSQDTLAKLQLVVLEGAAGIGKSMLAKQVRRAWGRGGRPALQGSLPASLLLQLQRADPVHAAESG